MLLASGSTFAQEVPQAKQEKLVSTSIKNDSFPQPSNREVDSIATPSDSVRGDTSYPATAFEVYDVAEKSLESALWKLSGQPGEPRDGLYRVLYFTDPEKSADRA